MNANQNNKIVIEPVTRGDWVGAMERLRKKFDFIQRTAWVEVQHAGERRTMRLCSTNHWGLHRILGECQSD